MIAELTVNNAWQESLNDTSFTLNAGQCALTAACASGL